MSFVMLLCNNALSPVLVLTSVFFYFACALINVYAILRFKLSSLYYKQLRRGLNCFHETNTFSTSPETKQKHACAALTMSRARTASKSVCNKVMAIL
jgi:uncharacterized membrane protein SpoIIM required for sporulation